jgi:CheY-like chemotaxis protein
MPLVDGKASTRLIRAYEKEHSPPISPQVESYGRIPIIAVSASLSEQSCADYVTSGFDGWILKPIDFTRLEAILASIQDEDTRKKLLYPKSKWEEGGWFKFKTDGRACCGS